MTPFTVEGLSTVLGEVLPEPHAGLLAGLLFGTKSQLPADIYDALIASGTIHIIALSGQNLSILGGLVAGTLTALVGRRAAAVLTMALYGWFVWFVGPSPSIVRAAIMGSIAVAAIIFGRQYWSLYSWALAVGSMILLNPAWIGDVSFILSAGATLGIILFGGPPAGNHPDADTVQAPGPVRRLGQALAAEAGNSLRLTFAAQTCTVPVIVWHFRRLSFITPVSNLLIGWVIGPLTGLGWVTALMGYWHTPLATPLAWFDWLLLEYIVRTVRFMSVLPGASWEF